MERHILLEKAYAYGIEDRDLMPEGCTYDRAVGVWRVQQSGKIMMLSDYAEKPQTKKCDIETGEDQKGE